jgi:hypothetical protein
VARTAVAGGLQLRLEVGHVGIGIAEAARLAEADAVDDRGVVERVGDDGVVFGQEGFEERAIGIEAGGEEDRVFGAEEAGEAVFKLAVEVLRAADEAD